MCVSDRFIQNLSSMCVSDRFIQNLSSMCVSDRLFKVHHLCVFLTGYSKDNMKLVQHFKQTGRYEPSAETQAIVNAKYQLVFPHV